MWEGGSEQDRGWRRSWEQGWASSAARGTTPPCRAGSKKSEGGQPVATQAGRVSLAPASFPVITPLVITIAAAAVH